MTTRGDDDHTRSITGVDVNDTGLWEFIPVGVIFDTPSSCRRSVFNNALTDGNPDNENQLRSLLDTCFAEFQACAGCTNKPCQGDLFTKNSRTESGLDLYDIQLNPRFGYVPRLTGSFPSGTSGTVQIAEFKPVHIQRLFVKCNANSCAVDFDPGSGDGPQNQSGKAADPSHRRASRSRYSGKVRKSADRETREGRPLRGNEIDLSGYPFAPAPGDGPPTRYTLWGLPSGAALSVSAPMRT